MPRLHRLPRPPRVREYVMRGRGRCFCPDCCLGYAVVFAFFVAPAMVGLLAVLVRAVLTLTGSR
jgi:hypothetical protein